MVSRVLAHNGVGLSEVRFIPEPDVALSLVVGIGMLFLADRRFRQGSRYHR